MAIRFWEIYKETKEKYKLRLLAGKNGMDNVISWVHMLEDETIISRFSGEELAVTTGMKSEEDGWLLHLVMAMKQAECTGIICQYRYVFKTHSAGSHFLVRRSMIFLFWKLPGKFLSPN